MTARQMKLGAFLWATGHHIAAWRHPQAHATAGIDIDITSSWRAPPRRRNST